MRSSVTSLDYLIENTVQPLLTVATQYTSIFTHAFRITEFDLVYADGGGSSAALTKSHLSTDSFLQVEESLVEATSYPSLGGNTINMSGIYKFDRFTIHTEHLSPPVAFQGASMTLKDVRVELSALPNVAADFFTGANVMKINLLNCAKGLDLDSVPTQLSEPSPSIDKLCTLQAGDEHLSNCVYCTGTGTDDVKCLNSQGAAGGRYRWIIDTDLNVNMSELMQAG